MYWRKLGGVAALALAVGCTMPSKETDVVSQSDGEPVVVLPQETPDPVASFPRAPLRPDGVPLEETPVENVLAVPFPTITHLSELIGKSEAEIFVLLGPASSKRLETPATILQYRVDECAVDLFLYMDMENNIFRTLAYDVKSLGQDLSVEQCMDKMQGGLGG